MIMEYGLIGKSLIHSFSKEIHSLIGNYSYELKNLNVEDISLFFTEKYFRGINVTIPYKKTVIPFLYFISDEAKKIGSVNTIINRNNKLYGYNTDYFGFGELLKHYGIKVDSRKILILGSGGTSATVKCYCEDNNANVVKVVSRHKSVETVTYEEAIKQFSDTDIIINTTPVGMFPENDSCPIDISQFENIEAVVDVIYNPLKTQLTISAEKCGVKSCNGLYMLVAQAVYSAALFFDDNLMTEKINSVYEKILKSKLNIVLIGMPSSGKTTIGRKLSELSSAEFYDTDFLIEQKTGKKVKEIFSDYGEGHFRKLETDIIKEISQYHSAVISTGGGAVLNETNINLLKQNGIVVFLDRSPCNLTANCERPLASNASDINKLYNQRINLYRKYADYTVNADKSVAEIINELKAIWKNENSCY